MRVARAHVLVIGVPVAIYIVVGIVGGKTGVVRDRAPFGIVALGTVHGTVIALGAMGIILVYRANRFINFAHGALGSMVGVIAIGLVLQHGLSYWIALPGAVIVGAALGALIEFLVIRRFQNSSRLVLTVATIGLAQLLGGLELIGSKAINFVSLVGGFAAPLHVHYRLDVHDFQGDELLIVAIVPAVIAALAWFLLKTDAGIGVRAAAENVDRALLLGIPVRRLSTIVWLIAGRLGVAHLHAPGPVRRREARRGRQRPHRPLAAARRRRRGPNGVAPTCVRGRRRPRHHGTGRALEQRRRSRRWCGSSTSS